MKRYFTLLTALVAACFSTYAQELKPEKVPEAVRAEFARKHPGMYVYEWEWKRKKELYKAEFAVNGSEHEAYFKSSGEWVYTEKEIPYTQVPDNVIRALRNSEYSEWKIDDTEELSTPEYPLLYKIEVEKGKSEADLYFLPDGTRITITNF